MAVARLRTMVDYDSLAVQDGEQAPAAFAEQLLPETSPARRAELRTALKEYCSLDTQAMFACVQTLGAGSSAPRRRSRNGCFSATTSVVARNETL